MVEIPSVNGGTTVVRGNGNGVIYEEAFFKGFVEGPGKSASSKNSSRVKRTFETADGREWVIWRDLENLKAIFSSINPNDKVRIGYKKQWDSYTRAEILNVQSIVKAVPELQNVPQEKPVSVDEPIISAKAFESKRELIQRLRAVQATLKTGVVPYLDELIKSVELAQDLK